MKHFYDIVFSGRNIDGNKKLFLPFQVFSNDTVTEQSLLPNFGACYMKVVSFFNF